MSELDSRLGAFLWRLFAAALVLKFVGGLALLAAGAMLLWQGEHDGKLLIAFGVAMLVPLSAVAWHRRLRRSNVH